MGVPSDLRTLVVHGLRLKGVTEPGPLASHLGIDEARTAELLDHVAAEGLARYRDGRFSGYSLTPEGRRALVVLLAHELDAAGLRGAVEQCYERFRSLNPELLEICTRWQLREIDGEPVMNDHTDGDHDSAVVEELVALHERAEPLLADLGGLLDRFARYGPALRDALARLRAGDLDAFTKPVVPSYHTVWFELHEDLLATLGIDRSAEVQPS
jgi:hypothetical protein